MSTGFGTPPVIPDDLQQYNSYVTDPYYARMFSMIWCIVLGFFVLLLALPAFFRFVAGVGSRRVTLRDIWAEICNRVVGVREEWDEDEGQEEIKGNGDDEVMINTRRKTVFGLFGNALGVLKAAFYWTIPGLCLNAGQIAVVIAYILAVVLCIVLNAPLVSNSNRAGFIALAQLPVLFLFGAKNSPLALLILPSSFSYDKVNFIHRWSGRLMFLGALLHGSLWIRNHLAYGIEIIGAQKEESGIAAFALLGIIAVTSLRPVRRGMWGVFWVVHILAFPAFFITVCYHTIYAAPWIFPPLAFYGLDLLIRMFKHRMLDAVLVPVDKQMTLVHIPHVTTGWRAGQHVRLRIFFSGGTSSPLGAGHIFESHPLSVYTAPPDVSCIRPESMPSVLLSPSGAVAPEGGSESEKAALNPVTRVRIPNGMSFGIRAVGDWSKAVNEYATAMGQELCASAASGRDSKATSELSDVAPTLARDSAPVPVPTQVTLSGPYGGCTIDLGEYETVLLFAGGAGATFTLGLLDDIVGRCVRRGRERGERTRRIEFAWCVRSFGSIDWFASALMDIANTAARSSTLDLHISIYVTCLCDPEAVPPIPNSDVTVVRPSVNQVLKDLTAPPSVKATGSKAKQGSTAHTSCARSDAIEDLEYDEEADLEQEPTSSGGVNVGSRLQPIHEGGGLAVCASGPEGLVREAANAVARLQMSGRGKKCVRVGLHTEVFMV